MKALIAGLLFVLMIAILFGIYAFFFQNAPLLNPLGVEKKLEKYTFERLRERLFFLQPITFGRKIKDGSGYSSYIFYFYDAEKRVSGLASIPSKEGEYPIVIQFRGYIDKEIYITGEGTRKSSENLAQNGFISLSPDFLGYGESDSPSTNSIEERFEVYTTSLSLIASVGSLNQALQTVNEQAKVDPHKIGIWGHSNGGHIALAVSSILGKPYPLVLWNPVTKPFPYSILYFTDEFDDHGKALRKVVADFEKEYDAQSYSPQNYYKWITSPMQLHQAENDEAVPLRWSDQFRDEMSLLSKDIEYYTYPSEDHNFSKGSWSTVMEKSIQFFKERL